MDDNEKHLIIENIRRLRHTLANVVPDLKVSRGVVAFICREENSLMVFSVKDGKPVYEKEGSDYVLPALLNLQARNIPLNQVTAADLKKLVRAFSYIEQVQSDRSHYNAAVLSPEDVSLHLLKKEMAHKLRAMKKPAQSSQRAQGS